MNLTRDDFEERTYTFFSVYADGRSKPILSIKPEHKLSRAQRIAAEVRQRRGMIVNKLEVV